MWLGFSIGVVVVAIGAYGFWMAGELGLAPRWRRPTVRNAMPADDIGQQTARVRGRP
jgi:hypothetical protein